MPRRKSPRKIEDAEMGYASVEHFESKKPPRGKPKATAKNLYPVCEACNLRHPAKCTAGGTNG